MFEFRNVNNDYDGYAYLIDFYCEIKDKHLETIPISFKNVSWISANTCSMIGAIFQKVQTALNTIKIYDLDHYRVKEILLRNGFLAFFGYERKKDEKGTTIQYQKFYPKDRRWFSEYIQNDLLKKEAMPTMSPGLTKKINEGITEIFQNAAMHSETKEGIFSCGQFFPTKSQIEFMITDLGIGIKKNVNRFNNSSYSAIDAIDWAIKERNTTKLKDSGGLGLAILMSFLKQNGGKIQIISNDGFWQFSDSGVEKKLFKQEFPGTAVNICFKTDDANQYILNGEQINDDELF